MEFRSITPHAVRLAAATVLSIALLAPRASLAGDNQASGDIAGNAANLGNSNVFTINTTQLALVKAAFLTDGTPISSGTTVPRGTPVKFMIYMDNTTSVPVDSVNVQDVLAAAFVYQPGTIRVSNTANSGSTAAAIYAAANVAPTLTDAVSNADVAGINAGTVSAGSGTGNALVTVPANKVWAMLFTVKVQ